VWALNGTEVFVVKEVIQPQVPLRLPCYDFTPVMNHTVVIVLPKVRLTTSGAIHSHGVTAMPEVVTLTARRGVPKAGLVTGVKS